jgi:hypothetical protein
MPVSEETPDFYPSWKVRLILRLEEFDQGVLKSRVPPKPSKNMKGIKDERAPLEVVDDPEVPGRFLLKPKNAPASPNTIAPDTSSDGLTHVIEGVIPHTFEWRQNGFRTADELKIRIRWSDMPLDPRAIRSVAVEFYLGTVTATEFAQGLRGITRGDLYGGGAAGAGEPLNIVPDSYLDEYGNRRTNLRFQGWVVKWKMQWSSTDEPGIDLECQDNTLLMLNQLAPARLVIGMKEPIDKAIATYLSNFPQFAGITVEYRGPTGAEVPKLEGTLAGTAFQPELGPPTGKGGGGGDDLVVWDYLTDVCGAIGHVCRIDGNAIIIQRPSTVLSGSSNARADDPYRTRSLPSGEFKARAFIFGRNIQSLDVSRDFAKGETKNVEVRCYSARRKKVLVARYPTKDARIATSTPGDQRAENKWTIVRITGVEDEKILQQIAEDVYNGRNRNEIEATIKTKNLSAFGSGNEDPDLLDMKAGDAVEILVDRSNPSTIAGDEAKLTAAGATEQLLKDLGYPPGFASAYARTYQNAGFQRLYRVKEMVAQGSVDEGVSIEVHGGNFVQARGELGKAGNTGTGT